MASVIIGFMAGIPIVVAAFEGAFGDLESIAETTRLTIFAVQVHALTLIIYIQKLCHLSSH